MLASILTFTQTAGYPLLFALIAAESAGVPLPGETALLTAASLAGQGKLSIALVIAVAATAAIIGDNIGYLVARRGGRRLLQRPGPFARQRRRVLEVGEPFFERHGPKAVFLGRWVLGLRTWASWLAGASRMPWRAFALWNAVGGISWALTIGLAGYFVGQSTASLFSVFGLIGLATVLIAAVGIFVDHRRRAHAALVALVAPYRRNRPAPRSLGPSRPTATRKRALKHARTLGPLQIASGAPSARPPHGLRWGAAWAAASAARALGRGPDSPRPASRPPG